MPYDGIPQEFGEKRYELTYRFGTDSGVTYLQGNVTLQVTWTDGGLKTEQYADDKVQEIMDLLDDVPDLYRYVASKVSIDNSQVQITPSA